MRSEFENALPHESTLRRWVSSVDGEPGFNTEALNLLKCMTDSNTNEVLVSLSLDEMALHSHIDFDGDKFVGNTGTIDTCIISLLHFKDISQGGGAKSRISIKTRC